MEGLVQAMLIAQCFVQLLGVAHVKHFPKQFGDCALPIDRNIQVVVPFLNACHFAMFDNLKILNKTLRRILQFGAF